MDLSIQPSLTIYTDADSGNLPDAKSTGGYIVEQEGMDDAYMSFMTISLLFLFPLSVVGHLYL